MGGVKFLIDLGCEVEDMVTGMKGIIISRSQSLYGCNMYFVKPRIDKDGKVIEGCWVDEGGIQVLAAPKIKKADVPSVG